MYYSDKGLIFLNFHYSSLGVVGLKSCGLYCRFKLRELAGLLHSAVIGTSSWGDFTTHLGRTVFLCRFRFNSIHKIFMSSRRHTSSSPQMSMASGHELEARQGVPHNDYIVNPPHSQPTVILRLV